MTHGSPIKSPFWPYWRYLCQQEYAYRYIQLERQAGEEQLPHREKRYSYSAENLKRGLIPNCIGIEH
ncbi:hypothetical protein EWM60_17350 [Candidatus Erwinia dacicola]|nr:hypothetical protein [Candidatus Erwinia dacicola]